MRKILPILLALIGLAAGGGVGFALRPDPSLVDHAAAPCGDVTATDAHAEAAAAPEADPALTHDYVKLNNQFVVPVVEEGKVRSLVVMSLSLETVVGQKEVIFAREPKIRDAFLQVLFEHANTGGFDGAFTASANMESLRAALLEVAIKVMGGNISDVLIIDMVRQDA